MRGKVKVKRLRSKSTYRQEEISSGERCSETLEKYVEARVFEQDVMD